MAGREGVCVGQPKQELEKGSNRGRPLEVLVQTQLQEFLNGASEKPYRELIQYHIKHMATRDLQNAVLGETQMLPPNLQEFIMGYVDATNVQFGHDQTFWAEARCLQAFDAIMNVAINAMPIRDRISSTTEARKTSNHNLAFSTLPDPDSQFRIFCLDTAEAT